MTNCHDNVIDIQTDYLQVLPKLNLNTLLEVDIFLLEAKSLIAVLTFLITEKNKTNKTLQAFNWRQYMGCMA